MKITRYQDIPKFTKNARYAADMVPAYLISWVKDEIRTMGLHLCPDFQRGHIWTKEQQAAYIEFILKGGLNGRDLYFNCPFWEDLKRPKDKTIYQDYTCVDGLQRITAWQTFLDDRLEVFGSVCSEFTDRWPLEATMRVHVNDLKSREEVLQWYIDMNACGTPHSREEIERVRNLLEREREEKKTSL